MQVDLGDPFVIASIILSVIFLIILPRVFPMFTHMASRWYDKGKAVQADRDKIEKVETGLQAHLDSCKEATEKNNIRLEALEHGMTEVKTLLAAREESAGKQHKETADLLRELVKATVGPKNE